MSEELTKCLFCGNDEPDVTTKEPLAMTLAKTDEVRCGMEGCPIENVTMSVAAWNKHYVCHDIHGEPVYAGNDIKITADDSPHGYKGKASILACVPVDGIPIPVNFVFEQAIREKRKIIIELIESEADHERD